MDVDGFRKFLSATTAAFSALILRFSDSFGDISAGRDVVVDF